MPPNHREPLDNESPIRSPVRRFSGPATPRALGTSGEPGLPNGTTAPDKRNNIPNGPTSSNASSNSRGSMFVNVADWRKKSEPSNKSRSPNGSQHTGHATTRPEGQNGSQHNIREPPPQTTEPNNTPNTSRGPNTTHTPTTRPPRNASQRSRSSSTTESIPRPPPPPTLPRDIQFPNNISIRPPVSISPPERCWIVEVEEHCGNFQHQHQSQHHCPCCNGLPPPPPPPPYNWRPASDHSRPVVFLRRTLSVRTYWTCLVGLVIIAILVGIVWSAVHSDNSDSESRASSGSSGAPTVAATTSRPGPSVM